MNLLLLLLAPAFISACASTSTNAPAPVLTPALAPEAAITSAASIKDPSHAAELAWLEGNDRALARKRLDQGLATHPHDPALLLRRALISQTELDENAALADLLAIIAHTPESPEAEVALILLAGEISEHVLERADIRAAITASHLLDAPPTPTNEDRATRVALASSIMSRIDALDRNDAAMKQDVTRGGWLSSWRGVGPLAPRTELSLRTPTEQETKSIDLPAPPLRGLKPPIRELNAWRLAVAPAAGDIPGLYVLETFFELKPELANRPLELEIHLRDSGRVLIDGTRVHEVQQGSRQAKSFRRVKLQLTPGWHRIAIAMLAGGTSRTSISLLAADGSPAIAHEQAAHPAGNVRLASTPPMIASDSTSLQRATSAEGWLEHLMSTPEHALFARILGVRLALMHQREDLDRARALAAVGLELAPRSAAMIATHARLMIKSGLPASLSQARIREALALDPENPSLLVQLARSILGDQPDAALAMIERAEKAQPKAAEPHELRFRIQQQRGWNAEAAKSLTQALALRTTESLLGEGAAFYRNMLRIDDARALEKRALELSEPSLGGRAANAALLDGDVDRAIRELREAARAMSGSASSLARIALLELGRGRVDEAIKAATEALDEDPLHVHALRTLAEAQRAKGELAKAEAAIDRLRAIGASDIRAETFSAEIGGGTLGLPKPGSWLAKELEVDPRALVTGAHELDARWSRYKSVRLLDRVIDRVAKDGRAVSVRHQIVRLQTKEATDQAGEINLPGEALPLALRTIKSDGRIIDVDRHSGKDDLSFSALAPGDAVEKQWVLIDPPETAWGGYMRRFFFQGSSPALRTELAVIAPKGAKLWWKVYNGAPEPQVHEENGETTYLFRAARVPAIDPEPSAVPQEEFLPFVVVGFDFDDARALEANAAAVENLAGSTWDIQKKAEELVKTAKAQTDADKVHAIYDFVTEEIGHGGAREPAIVLATKRGDRTGLFIAMLRAVGVDATIALARPGGAPQVTPPYPARSRFSVPMVRIEADKCDVLWARMDKESAWIGKATPDMRGGRYILPDVQATPQPIDFTDAEVDRWTLDSSVEMAIDTQGTAHGLLSITLPGNYASSLREFLRSARADDVHRALQEWVAIVLPGARLERWDAENLQKALEPLRLIATVTVPSFMVVENNHLIAEELFGAPIAMHALGFPTLAAYLRLPQRATPLYVNEVGEKMSVSLMLPATAKKPVEAPKSFHEESRFGRFIQEFTWNDTEHRAKLMVEQQLPAMRVPAADFPKFRDAAQQILQSSRNRLIVPLQGELRQASGS